MKSYRWLLFPGIFASFFIMGLFAGRVTGNMIAALIRGDFGLPATTSEAAIVANPSDFPLPAVLTPTQPEPAQSPLDARQRSILIIAVDQLNQPQANLESVWLAVYVPYLPQVTLVPIFPAIVSNSDGLVASFDPEFAEGFHLDPGRYPDPGFLAILENTGIVWTNFIVVDHELLSELLVFWSEEGRNENAMSLSHPSWSGPASALASIAEAPLEGLLAQVNFIQKICRAPANLQPTPQLAGELIETFLPRVGTDITPEQAARELEILLQFGGGVMCEFPFLQTVPTR